MSEQASEAPKKKGKLPVVIILAVVLGAGGFFGMKMRGGGEKKKEPEIKLGPTAEIKDEFLTNMAERSSYVRAKISLQVKDGFDPKKIEEDMPGIQDAINMKLQATSLKDVASLDGMRKLKKELAASINKILNEHPADDKDKDSKDDSSDKKDKDKKDKEKDKKAKDDSSSYDEIPEGWDSAKGPVLKVLFVSFATQ